MLRGKFDGLATGIERFKEFEMAHAALPPHFQGLMGFNLMIFFMVPPVPCR